MIQYEWLESEFMLLSSIYLNCYTVIYETFRRAIRPIVKLRKITFLIWKMLLQLVFYFILYIYFNFSAEFVLKSFRHFVQLRLKLLVKCFNQN